MTCSPARLLANLMNSAKSTGPRTVEGKAVSRANALKHGLCCETIVPTTVEDAAVTQRVAEFTADLKPTCPSGRALVERAALLSVRMERCVKHDNAATADRVEKALTDFDANRPEGPDPDPEKTARARSRAADLALFDPSKEASLARRYEAAAERGFFRALRELKAIKSTQSSETMPDQAKRQALASIRAASKTLADLKSDPIVPVSAGLASPPQPPSGPASDPNPPRLNRRQRRAALARRA